MTHRATLCLILFCAMLTPVNAQQDQVRPLHLEEISDGLDAIGSGEAITFEVSGMDLAEVFKSLAGKIGVNLVCSPKVQGKATLKLTDVNPATALRRVAETHGLGLYVENEVIHVVTEEEFREKWGRGPRDVTKVWYLKHADPTKVLAALQAFKTKRGNLSIDPRTGAIILVDKPAVVEYFDHIVQNLDVEVVTRAYKIEHTDAAALVKTIREALTPAGSVVTDSRTNTILVTDTEASQNRIEAFCKALDVPVQTAVFPLKHVMPIEAETRLKAVLPKDTNIQIDKTNCNIVVVADARVLQIAREVIQAIDSEPAIVTKEFRIQYADGEAIEKSLKECVTKELGDVHYDKYSRTLTVRDLAGRVDTIAEMITAWDRRNIQVRIEVKLCEVTLSKEADYGIDWNVVLALAGAQDPTTYAISPFFRRLSPNTINTFTVSSSQFGGVLEFLETRGKVDVVSAPNVTVVEGYDAELYVGTTVPIAIYDYSKETGVRILSGYDEKDIGIILKVNPSVDENGLITMDVQAEASQIIGWRGEYNERPVTSTRKATTEVRLKSGDWVVLGGLMSTTDREDKQGIPIISMIPVIGIPFRQTVIQHDKGELAIFLSPNIVEESDASRLSVGKQSLRVPLQDLEGLLRTIPEPKEQKIQKKGKN